ncbi:MAG: penicillin-binding transpeptidase domain-containing protein [Chloroflexota bacterium]
MKITRWTNQLVIVIILLAACGRTPATVELPTPYTYTTPAPNVETTLRAYLDAFALEDYTSMYALLDQASQAAVTEEDFAKKHRDALNAMSAGQIEYAIQSTLTNPDSAQAAYGVTYKTALFGDIARNFVVAMALEDGGWRIQWNDGLILPELAGGKVLVTYYNPAARGDIYDRNGEAIATEAEVYSLGLVAGAASPDLEDALFRKISQLTGVPRSNFEDAYFGYNAGDYVPVGEALAEDVENSGILEFGGAWAVPYTSRYYTPGIAPQTVGHLLFLNETNTEDYLRLGYSPGDRVGVQGIEAWGEEILHGRNGATLYVAAADNSPETVLAQAESQPASSLTLTLDADLQAQAQAAMDGLPGAIVVMEVDTGRILAMVSSPAPDTNWYDPQNYNFMALGNMLSTPGIEDNKASRGTYPLGSVFKIVTMAAALESGVFTAEDIYDCQYDFTELVPHGGPVLHDWTYMYCEEEKLESGTDTCTTKPSGVLTLPQGLMRSCDPWFYHIGLTLFDQGLTASVSDMANGFGLGQLTGIEQVEEDAGQIPVPTSYTEATSLAIGQGGTLVTPLQVADFIAAIANGGTLYRPQLVESILPVSGEAEQVFRPEALGTLPVSAENLQTIQEAMRSVAENPRGTAYARLGTFAIPTAGKTGTAESGTQDPHAWFAGYSLANRPDQPDIAVVVIVEYQGEGSVWALPIFRRVMEIYFFGSPQTIYPWESSFGVIRVEEPTP